MRGYTANSIGRHLVSMVNKGAHIKLISGGTNLVFRIFRPKSKPKVKGEVKPELSGVNLIPECNAGDFDLRPVWASQQVPKGEAGEHGRLCS